MSTDPAPGSNDQIGRYLAPGGDNVKLVYVLYLLGFVIGLSLLVGLVMAYLNRREVRGAWPESHYTYQIRTFWIGLLYAGISILLMIVGIGFLLMIGVAIWAIVRCVRGLQWAAAGQAVKDPLTWIV